MNILFRLTVKHKWESKKTTLYVMMSTRKEAVEYVTKHLKEGVEIISVCALGRELSGCMYSNNKEERAR